VKTTKRKTTKKRSEKKRSLFAEIEEGMLALKAHREGKITLREHTVRPLVLPTIDGSFIQKVRDARGLSRAAFAHKLGLSPRSLERWEQELSAPPAPVAALILMAAKYPDTFDRLAALEQPTPSKANAESVIHF
jgi:putative transcriptional regulator